MEQLKQRAVSLTLVLIGIVGLAFKVEYSGWVLFTGLIIAW